MNLHLCNNLQLKLRNNIGRNNLVALRELRFLILYIPHNRTQVLERVCIKCFHPHPPPPTVSVSATTSLITIPVAKSLVFGALVHYIIHSRPLLSSFFQLFFRLLKFARLFESNRILGVNGEHKLSRALRVRPTRQATAAVLPSQPLSFTYRNTFSTRRL